ncbi:MAG: hypothetical protein DDT19_02016 [Syntrophomonadaceae bacterium]|nr:hypothetical protein [Bacillota bacterium]
MANENRNNSERNFGEENNLKEIDLPEKQEARIVEQNKVLEPEILESENSLNPELLDTQEVLQRISELPPNIRDFFKSFNPEDRRIIVSDQFLMEHNNAEINQYYDKMKEEMIDKIVSTDDYPLLKNIFEKVINDTKIKQEDAVSLIDATKTRLDELRQELLLSPSGEEPPSILRQREKIQELEKEKK